VAGTVRLGNCAQKRNLKRIGHFLEVVKPGSGEFSPFHMGQIVTRYLWLIW